MHPTCHIYVHEESGYAYLHQLKAILLGPWQKTLSLDSLVGISEPIATLVCELPQRHNGGSLPTWKALVDMQKWCRETGTAFHLDGARLWEAQAYYQKPFHEICALFDSTYVSFYKGLGGIGGAMLLGNLEFINQARVWQRRHGGNLIHLFPYAVSAELGMQTHLHKMEDYRSRAEDIAKIIGKLSEMTLTPSTPQTNMMHVSFRQSKAAVENAALETSAETGVWILQNLWERSFTSVPIFELYVGQATIALDIDRVQSVLEAFNAKLARVRS